jgi:hypothetical protein
VYIEMLVYTDELEKMIRRKYLSRILISPKGYKLKGSFSRKSRYVTDVDVCTYFDPKYSEQPIKLYERLKKIMYYVAGQDDIIFVEAKCGYNDNYKITTASDDEILRIRPMLKIADRETFNILVEKYNDDREILSIALKNFLKKIYRYHWSLREIFYNQKVIYDGSIIKLTDILMKNNNILVRYFVNCMGYYIGIDSANYYSKNAVVSVRDKYDDLLPAYRHENFYYYALFVLRYRLRKTHYEKISEVIDKKFGISKQVLTQIDNYLKMIALDLINYPIAEIIRTSLIKDIQVVNQNNSLGIDDRLADLKKSKNLFQWGKILREIQIILEIFLNASAKPYYQKYLELIPENERAKYYF